MSTEPATDQTETASACTREPRRNEQKNVPAFQPSARQSQFAKVLATDKDALTITALCEKAGVSRNTLYRWQRDVGFQLWLGRTAMQTLVAISPTLPWRFTLSLFSIASEQMKSCAAQS